MKTKILFFSVFLFLLLLVFLSTHTGKVFDQNSFTQKTSDQFSKSLFQDIKISIIRKHDLTPDKDDDIISLENDDDFGFVKKQILPTRYLIPFLLASIFIFSLTYLYNRLLFCDHFSYAASQIYLIQRVLRI